MLQRFCGRSGNKTSKHVQARAQCNLVSIGLTQACPNHANKVGFLLQMFILLKVRL